jgi:hypothetical protein
MPSKCGLKIIRKADTVYVVVAELYQENTGTSVTYAGKLLRKQIGEAKGLDPYQIRYLECMPQHKFRAVVLR